MWRRGRFSHTRLIGIHRGEFSKKYEKVRVLGAGADGTAYVVRSKGASAGGAEKVAKEAHDISEEAKQKFVDEFEKLRGLDHSNVLKVYEMVEGVEMVDDKLQSEIYVITDLAKGGDLSNYFTKMSDHTSVTEEWVAGVFHQAMAGVIYLHRHNVAHNDLKPENILMMDEFSPAKPQYVPLVVLTDFGRATLHTDMRFSHGDLRYQAPEVWEEVRALQEGQAIDEEKQLGYKADVWSMGVTLFELMSGGRLPFLYEACSLDDFMDSEDKIPKFQSALRGPDTVNVRRCAPMASNDVADLISQLLCKSPDIRPEARNIIQHSWFNIRGRPLDDSSQKKLTFFSLKGRAHAMLLNAMASKLQSDHYSQCTEAFKEIDKNLSGTISLSEFKSVFASKFQADTTNFDVERLFKLADVDRSGKLSFNEFVAITFDWHKLDDSDLDNQLSTLFQHLDHNQDGRISQSELRTAFQGAMRPEELTQIFKSIDVDGDDISIDELRDFLFRPATDEEMRIAMTPTTRRQSVKYCLSGCLAGLSKLAGRET